MKRYHDLSSKDIDVLGLVQRRTYQRPAIRDLDMPLETCPHYTDARFDKEQTVYGAAEKGLNYEYDDRIVQWDYEKHKIAAKAATESGAKARTARWYNFYLSVFYGFDVEVRHIEAGVNRSNGYPYCVFGFHYPKERLGREKPLDGAEIRQLITSMENEG